MKLNELTTKFSFRTFEFKKCEKVRTFRIKNETPKTCKIRFEFKALVSNFIKNFFEEYQDLNK